MQLSFFIHTFVSLHSPHYNVAKEVFCVKNIKHKVIVTDFEHRLLVKALVEFRNQLLDTGKPTDDINELLLRIIDIKKHRWWR